MATEHEPTTPAVEQTDLLDTPAAGPSAIRGSAMRTVGYVLGILLSLIAVPLLFGHLGDADYGHYVTVIALVTIVQGVTDVGLGQIGVREFATRVGTDRERLMRNLVGVRFALTSVGVVLATAFALIVGYAHAVVIGTLLAGTGMVLTVAQGTFVIPLAAGLRLGWITALDLLRQVLSVAGIVILVFAGASLLPFLAVSVPVSVVLLVATLALVRGNVTLRPSFDLPEWTLLMRSVLPFAAAVVVGTLYLRVTVVLTSLLASQKQNGYYAISFTVISVLVAIPALTVGSTLPVLARAARDDQDRLGYVLGRLVDVTMIVGVGLALGLALGAGFVTHVLTQGKPGSATTVLQIQSVAVVTQFVGSSWQYALLSIRRHRALLMISASGLVVSVCATLILVPPLQARGAAIAFACGEGTVAVLSFVALRVARPDIRFSLRVPARVVLAAVVGSTAALIPGLASLPVSLVGGALFCAVLLASRAVPPELMHAARNRPKPLAR